MWCTRSNWMILQSLYDYNRIPFWILNQNNQIIDCFFGDVDFHTKQTLLSYIPRLALIDQSSDFSLICFENELYYRFTCDYRKQHFTVIGGPMLLSGFFHITQMHSLSFAKGLKTKELELLVENLPVISFTSFGSALRIIMLLLKGNAPALDEIRNYPLSNKDHTKNLNFVHELFVHEHFENAEDYREHTSYREEVAVLSCVREGNIAQLEATYKTQPETKYGKMSNHPLRQLFYGCIANTTLVTRYAIEGGLEEETAFTLSDVYIKQMETCKTLYELNALNEKMAIDFTQRVARAKAETGQQHSKAVTACIGYIKNNIHEHLCLEQLAALVGLTPKYLSWLFRSETNMTLSSYIEELKIAEAKNLLRDTRYSSNQISQHLSYHSQSYFISRFKKLTGLTPEQYRKQV